MPDNNTIRYRFSFTDIATSNWEPTLAEPRRPVWRESELQVVSRTRASEIYRETIENGGGTYYSDGSPLEAAKGFLVATSQEPRGLVNDWDEAAFVGQVQRIAQRYASQLIGTWVFEGKIYIDTVRMYERKEYAMDYARAYRQRAIYDLVTKETIDVPRG